MPMGKELPVTPLQAPARVPGSLPRAAATSRFNLTVRPHNWPPKVWVESRVMDTASSCGVSTFKWMWKPAGIRQPLPYFVILCGDNSQHSFHKAHGFHSQHFS